MKFDLKEGTAEIPHDHAEPVKEFAVDSKWRDCPSINIVIMIVGSRGVYSTHFIVRSDLYHFMFSKVMSSRTLR